VHKFVLQPNEEGKVEIRVDTSRFVGRKTKSLLLTTKQGGITRTYQLTVTGIAKNPP
jgi:hypothetical protein